MKLKLDSRIIEGKKPLTYFDIEEAKHFIGRKGYFSDCVPVFANLDNATLAILGMVNDNDWFQPFMATSGAAAGKARYFLPEEWVQEKEPEPVWKPYDLDTWRNDNFRIGSAITFRIKPKKGQDSKNTIVKTMVYLGREEHSDDLNDIFIYIGTLGYSFKYLFENYEIFDDKYEKPGCPKWRLFGCRE